MTDPATGTPVRFLQQMLRQISEIDPSIPAVIPDGIYGRDTRAAVSAFQRREGLPVTGVTDLDTWEAISRAAREARLETAPADSLSLRMDRGQSFAHDEENALLWPIQGALAAICASYENAPQVGLSGVNDAPTQAAVRFVQSCSGLPETGLIDRRTWLAISRLFSQTVGNGLDA